VLWEKGSGRLSSEVLRERSAIYAGALGGANLKRKGCSATPAYPGL